jgi:methionine-rich copper-binding protein CopC
VTVVRAAFFGSGGPTAAAGLAAVVAVLLVGLPASPASAHARLIRTDPAENTTVANPVTAITLTFNEPVKQRSTTVAVSASDDSSYSEGDARVVDTAVIQAVRPVPAGDVRVVWRTVSADGDPIQGEYRFTMAPPAAPTTTPPTTTPPPAAPTTTPPPVVASSPAAVLPSSGAARAAVRTSSRSAWWLAGGGVVVLVAVAGALWWRRRA